MKNASGKGSIRSTEIDREIEHTGSTVACRSDCRAIVVPVKTGIRRWNGQKRQCMNLLIWPVGRLRVVVIVSTTCAPAISYVLAVPTVLSVPLSVTEPAGEPLHVRFW